MSGDETSAGSSRSLRYLLPRQPARPSLVATVSTLRSRLKPVVAACNACRAHKVKCSGQRPTCGHCARRRVHCTYTTRPGETQSRALTRTSQQLLNRTTAYEELFALVRNLSDQDAQGVIKRIRAGDDAETIVRHYNTGDVLLEMAVTPETNFRYVFPYKREMPADLIPNNPYLNSLLLEPSSLYHGRQDLDKLGNARIGSEIGQGSRQRGNSYLKPFHAAQLVDSRLDDVRISRWTNVCKDDKLMRDLLKAFFLTEYQFTAAFPKDLFLDDMAKQRKDFCSSLLVNTILAYACVCYPKLPDRFRYWDPQSLMYRFLAEARRIWELEATEARLTTIQSGILFTVIHNLCGLDEIGSNYRIHAINLAHVYGLFNETENAEHDRRWHGRVFTAWALYNWESLTAFSFMTCPSITKPPDLPLPDTSTGSQLGGEIWLKYPSDHELSSSCFGQVLRAKCQLRIIMNDFCTTAYAQDSTFSLLQAHELHDRLRKWFCDLPESLKPKEIVLPEQLQLHMYYHHIILSMFRPLLNDPGALENVPGQIVKDAETSLKTLVRLYYLRHGFEAMDLFIVIPLTILAYECVDAINEHTSEHDVELLRPTLILVTQGLYTQQKNHYLAQALFKVIRGRMRAEEALLLTNTIQPTAQDDPVIDEDMTQEVRSRWPISVPRTADDVQYLVLARLVEEYVDINIQNAL